MKNRKAIVVSIIEVCAVLLILISFSAISGKIFDWPALVNWGFGVNLSLPACAGFFLAGIAIRMLLHNGHD